MEHDVAYYSVSPFLEEEKDRFVLYCCEKNGKAKEYILCPRPSIIFGYKPGKSAYLIYESGHIPDKINTEYMATDDAMDMITQNINNLPEIRRRLGRDGVMLAEKIRTAAVAEKRRLSDISNSIVVSEVKRGEQTRVVIWDFESKKIIDAVRIRTDYNGTETLEGFIKRLKAVSPNINIYCIKTSHEVLEKFSRYGFINVFANLDEINDDSTRAKVIKSRNSVIMRIKKRFNSCKELDRCFPFV